MHSEDQELLFELIKKKQPLEQPKIINFMKLNRTYKNELSARNSVGIILKRLERDGHITKTQIQINKGIPKNVWRTT
jgi:hypothetical protein